MTNPQSSPSVPEASIIRDVACTVCGCVCDDLRLTIQDNRIVELQPGCPLAERWIIGQDGADQLPTVTRVDGQPCSMDIAIHRAVEILNQSQAPLIYGLSRSSTRGQQAATQLADFLGATIDTTASTCHAPSIMALQSVGESTCTLGEIRHRSDLVIYWGSNPLRTHPRHMERYVDSPGMWTPGGRTDRTVVVVDVEETESAAAADLFIQVDPGGDFDLLWALRCLVAGVEPSRPSSAIAGVTFETIQTLAKRMMSCRYGAAFFGLGLTKHAPAHANVEALLRLVTDLNAHTRFVARRMRVPGDVAGADTVLCWQTGFPFSVNLARGYPRFNPGEYTANDLLERKEVDAALLVGSEGISKLSTAAQSYLGELPLIVLDYPNVESPLPPTVEFTTAIYGIHEKGTAYRMDEVPIPLKQVLDSPLPADHEVLHKILAGVSSNST